VHFESAARIDANTERPAIPGDLVAADGRRRTRGLSNLQRAQRRPWARERMPRRRVGDSEGSVIVREDVQSPLRQVDAEPEPVDDVAVWDAANGVLNS